MRQTSLRYNQLQTNFSMKTNSAVMYLAFFSDCLLISVQNVVYVELQKSFSGMSQEAQGMEWTKQDSTHFRARHSLHRRYFHMSLFPANELMKKNLLRRLSREQVVLVSPLIGSKMKHRLVMQNQSNFVIPTFDIPLTLRLRTPLLTVNKKTGSKPE